MPYHDPEKPMVAAWFSATKRSFADCCAPEGIEQLRAERGLCVLYQYMHRYADLERGRVKPEFEAAATRLRAASDVLVDTTERIMDRLQLVQGVSLAARGATLWIVNANDQDVQDLQIELEGARPAGELPAGAARQGAVLHFTRLTAGQIASLTLDRPVRIDAPRVITLDAEGRGSVSLADGKVYANAGATPWRLDERHTIAPRSCVADLGPRPGHRPLARAGRAESYALLAGQLATIAGEILWKGRSLSSKRFLSSKKIALEDHANW